MAPQCHLSPITFNPMMHGTWCTFCGLCSCTLIVRSGLCSSLPAHSCRQFKPPPVEAISAFVQTAHIQVSFSFIKEVSMQIRMQIVKTFTAFIAALSIAALAAAVPGAGTVTGKVTYTGTPVKPKAIDMSKEPSCAKQHTTPEMTETIVSGPGNTLENVVVYISSGVSAESSPPSSAVTLDQKGCRYVPHVLPFQVNQELKITNSDETSHNIHPLAKINQEWNKS